MSKQLPAMLAWPKVARTLVRMSLSPADFLSKYQYRSRRHSSEPKPLPFTRDELNSLKLYYESRMSARSFYALRMTFGGYSPISVQRANKIINRYLWLAEQGRIPDELLPKVII